MCAIRCAFMREFGSHVIDGATIPPWTITQPMNVSTIRPFASSAAINNLKQSSHNLNEKAMSNDP